MLTDKEQEEIRRKLLGLEEEPPANGWNKIAAEIHPPRRPNRLWWLLIAALLLLVGSFGVLYFVKQTETPVITTTGNKPELNSESKSGEIAATQKTTKVERANQTTQELKESVSDLSKVTGKDSEVSTNRASDGSQEAPPKNPEQQPDTDSVPVAKVPKAKEPAKLPLPLPLLAEGKKPRTRYKTETLVTTKESEITNKIEESIETTIASQPDETKENRAGNNETDNTNSYALLKGRVTQLDSLHNFVIPDSVSIALVPDSAAKVVRTPTVDSVAKSREWYVGVTFAPRYTFRSFTPLVL